MEIRTVWGVYFSATGTTEKIVTCIAKTAAELMDAEYKTFSFSLPEARKHLLSFSGNDLVIFGIPVYAGRIPNLLLPYIKENVTGNGAAAVPVVLFGNRNYDDALIELRNIMQENGFHNVAAGAFVGEHSFSVTLGVGRPDEDDMALAVSLAEKTAAKIRGMKWPPAEAVAVRGNDPLRPYYTPRDRHGNPINILKVKPKTDLSKCIKCGLCAAICTMGAIDTDDLSAVPGVCTKCCACVKRCPVQAKYYDDEGYLYHQRELEDVYTHRASVDLFF